MREVWKDILDYEGLYQASNYGNIRSLGNRSRKGVHIRKPRLDKDGYLFITLHKDGKSKTYRVHRLVWEAFYGKIPQGMQVNHINERKDDNRISNLNLMDCKDNINWGSGIERRAKQVKKKVIQMTLEGEEICCWFSAIDAERELKKYYNVAHQSIAKCCKNETGCKTHMGFRWKYA